MRADAARNRAALLAAGRAVFRAEGTEASVDDVAKRAGVGKGTLYRHFPTKDHLIAAILQDHFDDLTAAAEQLITDPDPMHAIAAWVRDFDRGPTHFPGLRERMAATFADETSEISRACGPMKLAFRRLLDRGQQARAVRDDVASDDLLRLIASLPHAGRDPEDSSPMLDIVLRGIAVQNPAGIGRRSSTATRGGTANSTPVVRPGRSS
jgi:AcrR family transcriptional regulator